MVTNDQILEKIETLLKIELMPVKQGLSRLETRQNILEEQLIEIKGEQIGMREELKDVKEDQIGMKEELINAIKESQDDTIEALTNVINEGYTMHDERIVRIENHLHLPPLKH